MANIILTAENFAFGPIGKLLDVAKLLKDRNHKLTFAGYGTSYQLAKNFPFDTLLEIDTDNPKNKKSLQKIISKGDILVSSMDIPSIEAAKNVGIPTVWLDSLFWFWTSIPKILFNVNVYIKERSLDDTINERKYGHKIKNLYTVGPILPKIEKAKKIKQAIISFGGGEAFYWYKEGVNTNFPTMMTKILLDYVDWSEFDKVILATNERILSNLSQKFPNSPFKFTTCGSHRKFLKELARSEVALITPGLITSQSAFNFETPSIFLPPSNNSQYLQIDEFRKLGLAIASVHLDNFLPRLELRGKDPHKTIKEVLNQLRQIDKSTEQKQNIGKAIQELVSTRHQWSRKSTNVGREFLDSLGGNGIEDVVDKIEEIILTSKK